MLSRVRGLLLGAGAAASVIHLTLPGPALCLVELDRS